MCVVIGAEIMSKNDTWVLYELSENQEADIQEIKTWINTKQLILSDNHEGHTSFTAEDPNRITVWLDAIEEIEPPKTLYQTKFDELVSKWEPMMLVNEPHVAVYAKFNMNKDLQDLHTNISKQDQNLVPQRHQYAVIRFPEHTKTVAIEFVLKFPAKVVQYSDLQRCRKVQL